MLVAGLLAGCLSGSLSGCATAPPLKLAAPPGADAEPPLLQRYAQLQQAEGGSLYRLDGAASALRIYVFRAGRAARLGHNHVLTAPQLSGALLLPEGGTDGARFELEFRLDELRLDEAAQRALLGPGWASALSAEALAATRSNMLGAAGLQAETFPWARIRSVQVVGELPKLAAQVEVVLHGQSQRYWLPLQVELTARQFSAKGALLLRQSDFGLSPFSVGGGLLAVRDELLIEFDLLGGLLSGQ